MCENLFFLNEAVISFFVNSYFIQVLLFCYVEQIKKILV